MPLPSKPYSPSMVVELTVVVRKKYVQNPNSNQNQTTKGGKLKQKKVKYLPTVKLTSVFSMNYKVLKLK